MASTFLGFNISRSGLMSSQQGLNVTSHNISNVNTEGFTRQRMDFIAEWPEQLHGLNGSRGLGVQSLPIIQIRNEFLDAAYRKENCKAGEFQKRYEVFSDVESIINEPSNSGFTTMLDNFYKSLQELNKLPESVTTRSLVRQRTISMTAAVNNTAAQFQKSQGDLDYEIGAYVRQINGYAKELADLNEQIYKTEVDGGGKSNDIRDQRNLILDKLSELVNINYHEDHLGRFSVTIQGHHLVSHTTTYELDFKNRIEKKNDVDINNLHEISWKDGSSFNLLSGKLKGALDMRDGMSAESKGIPYYMDKLNQFIDVIANEMNRIHQTGYDLDKGTGTFFFTENNMTTAEYKAKMLNSGLNGNPAVNVSESAVAGVTLDMKPEEKQRKIEENISNILKNNSQYKDKKIMLIDSGYYIVDRMNALQVTISKDLDMDLNKFAASNNVDVPGNGQNALNLADTRTNVRLYEWGSPDDFVRILTTNLGVDGQEAKRVSTNQSVLLKSVSVKRSSVSGVSLDEEMSEMLKFQHAYNANARMITTIDGMLDTLINRLGAGR